jgi:hypothetical protein
VSPPLNVKIQISFKSMLRHLKNANELVLYASLSCLAAFIGRLFPAFYFPILLLRLGMFGYCFYIIAHTEGNRELAIILGGSILIGLIGGYWDLIEVYLRYKQSEIGLIITLLFIAVIGGLVIIVKRQGGQDGTTR